MGLGGSSSFRGPYFQGLQLGIPDECARGARCEMDVITAKAVCFALPGHARQPAGGRHYLSAPETARRRTTRRCAASARDRCYWLPRAVDRRQRRSAELLTFPDSNALLPAQGYWLAPRFMFASITHRSFPGERGVFLTSCGPSFSHRFSDPQFLTLGIRTSV